MFQDFQSHLIDTGDLRIFARSGGSGPPLLLLHGYPQNHACWHAIAPQLAEHFTVVVSDLRGYGQSDKPAGLPDHSNYAKRTVAQDQVKLMQALGFDRFHLVGHDRGARVSHRLVRDWPQVVMRMALLDIIPTVDTWNGMDWRDAIAAYHWPFLAQAYDLPERLIAGNPDFYLRWTLNSWADKKNFWSEEAYAAYLHAFMQTDCIHGMCEDYRAGASIDLVHDAEDTGRKIEQPLLVLWGGGQERKSEYPFLETWRRYAENVSGGPLPSGHFLAEEAPEATLESLLPFLLA